MRVWVCRLCAFFVSAQFAAPLCAATGKLPLELGLEAPEPCPSASAFLAAVTRLVGGTEQISRRVRANVTIRRDGPDDFRLMLTTELDGISGERELRGRSCSAVADVAVVTLALILNPDVEIPADAGIEATNQTVKLPYSELVAIPPTPVAMAPARPRSEEPTRISWLGVSSLGLHLGVSPHPGPELSLGLGANYGQLSLLALGSYAPPETSLLVGQGQMGGRLWHGTLRALSCWSFSATPPLLGTCLGGAVTRVEGHGVGVTEIRHGSTTWFSPSLGIYADFPLSKHAAFRLMGTGEIPLARPDTHLDGIGPVQRPAVLTARLQAGVIVDVP